MFKRAQVRRVSATSGFSQSSVHRGGLQCRFRRNWDRVALPFIARFSAPGEASRTLRERRVGHPCRVVEKCVAEWGTVGYSGAAFTDRGGGAPPTPPPRSRRFHPPNDKGPRREWRSAGTSNTRSTRRTGSTCRRESAPHSQEAWFSPRASSPA